jgi:hypothetical protein
MKRRSLLKSLAAASLGAPLIGSSKFNANKVVTLKKN